MKDSVVRGRLLHLLGARRDEDFLPFGTAEHAIPPPQGIDDRDWLRAVAQLAEYELIDWRPSQDETGRGKLGGLARINDLGMRILAGETVAPITIALQAGSKPSRPRVSKPTAQQQEVAAALEKVIKAVAAAEHPAEEKAKALLLVWKLLESKAGAAALGTAAQSLMVKYFAD
jgi:hypothetical protein